MPEYRPEALKPYFQSDEAASKWGEEELSDIYNKRYSDHILFDEIDQVT